MRPIALIGPTACGKTALALQFALRHGCEVISVDSALIYRGMDIGTAKPTPEERREVPHHLIDIRDPFEPFSVADFLQEAAACEKDIASRGGTALYAGGTMLYAHALFHGLDVIPEADPEVRKEVAREGVELGWPAMHAKLASVDPTTASRLSLNDSQRIGRALEVWRQTGRALSSFQTGIRSARGDILKVGLMPSDRAKLHARIKGRFAAMLEAGFLEEVKALMAHPSFSREAPSMRAVGYRQAIAHLCGETDYETFVKDACTATRRLAKRQMTWMRGLENVALIDPDTEDAAERLASIVEKAAP